MRSHWVVFLFGGGLACSIAAANPPVVSGAVGFTPAASVAPAAPAAAAPARAAVMPAGGAMPAGGGWNHAGAIHAPGGMPAGGVPHAGWNGGVRAGAIQGGSVAAGHALVAPVREAAVAPPIRLGMHAADVSRAPVHPAAVAVRAPAGFSADQARAAHPYPGHHPGHPGHHPGRPTPVLSEADQRVLENLNVDAHVRDHMWLNPYISCESMLAVTNARDNPCSRPRKTPAP